MLAEMVSKILKKQRDIGLLGPSNLFFVFWFFGVIVPLVPFLNETDGFSLMWPYRFNDKMGSLVFALLIYSVVLFFFIFGYNVARQYFVTKKEVLTRASPGGLSFEFRATIISAIGLISVVLLIYLVGGIGSWLQAGSDRIRVFAGLNFIVLLQNGLLAVSIGWFIKITDGLKNFRAYRHCGFLVFSSLVFALVAFQGAKSTLFVYLFAMLVIWHAKVKSLSFWRLSVIGAILYVSLMAYHLVKQEYLAVGYFVFYEPNDGWIISFVRFLSQQLTGNLMQLQTMTVLVDAIPDELNFQYGETLKMVFLIWVPSLLYADKPLTAPGVFTTALWPEKWIAEGTTMPPGLFGEFFMNFGLFGVIPGSVFFGFIYGVLYMRAVQYGGQANLGLYALMAGLLLHYFRGELASVTVLLLSLAIPLVWVLRGQSKAERKNLRRFQMTNVNISESK